MHACKVLDHVMALLKTRYKVQLYSTFMEVQVRSAVRRVHSLVKSDEPTTEERTIEAALNCSVKDKRY